MTSVGNGIQLVDTNPADGPITVTANSQSTAAVDLGLIPAGQTSATSTLVTVSGITGITSGGTNGMTTNGNAVQVLTGDDANPQATPGVFTALLQLTQALQNNNTGGIQSALKLLDQSTQNLNNAQAEVVPASRASMPCSSRPRRSRRTCSSSCPPSTTPTWRRRLPT